MKKLTYIPLVILYLLQWVFTVAQNLAEVFANGFAEIILALENFINPDEAKPSGSQSAADTTESN